MNNNFFLYLTSFICSGAIMSVELTASRFLAPYYGSSMVVWSALIGIILVAISFGNFWGGIIADKENCKQQIFNFILLAAIWICLIPIAGRYIIAALFPLISVIIPGNVIASGSLISSITLFGFPCLLLGTVSPALIKLITLNLENNGRQAGKLFAVSTMGSFIGALLPTFVFIPFMGTYKTFIFISIILILLHIFYRIKDHNKISLKTGLTFLLILSALLIPFKPMYAFWKTDIEEYESLYNYIQLKKRKTHTSLSTHVEIGSQSYYSKSKLITKRYYDYGLVAPYFSENPDVKKILILGLGAGTFARQCRHYWPESEIDGVEIDKNIVELGLDKFELSSAELNIHIEDARTFLIKNRKRYDLIFLDVFKDVTIPFHLSSIEFFKLVKENMNHNGSLFVNFNLPSDGPDSLQIKLGKTIRNVFPKVWQYTLLNNNNSVFFAGSEKHSKEYLMRWTENNNSSSDQISIAKRLLKKIKTVTHYDFAFTDDFSPVEKLSMRVTNKLIHKSINEYLNKIKIF